MRVVRAYAPASLANFAVGFDIIGAAIQGMGDEVTLEKAEDGVKITSISGDATIPMNPEKNTAGKALLEFIELNNLEYGFNMSIKKGIPLASGLGGSAASAVAATIAADRLSGLKLSKETLLRISLSGELISSGSVHTDNVAPSLYGGITVSLKDKNQNYIIQKIPSLTSLKMVMIHPHLEISTKEARDILRQDVPLNLHVQQSMNLAAFIISVYTAQIDLLKKTFDDLIIEPQRASLIPDFSQIKSVCQNSGAIGCSISGAGPTMFAVCDNAEVTQKIESSLKELKTSVKLDVWTTNIDTIGARILEVKS